MMKKMPSQEVAPGFALDLTTTDEHGESWDFSMKEMHGTLRSGCFDSNACIGIYVSREHNSPLLLFGQIYNRTAELVLQYQSRKHPSLLFRFLSLNFAKKQRCCCPVSILKN